MLRYVQSAAAAVVLCLTSSVLATPPTGYQLSFSDEFNTGVSDIAGWSYDLGNGTDGWGNNERQNYTNNAQNVFVTDGNLNIRVIATGSGANQTYTSTRIRSNNVFSQTRGYFEWRAKMPAGQGLWPALWMMPKDSAYGGWPRSGEIDVFEGKGQDTGLVQASLHSGNNSNSHVTQTQTLQGAGKRPAGFTTTAFHTYAVQWDTSGFKFYCDDILYQTRTNGWFVPGGGTSMAPFDKPFYIIMNMAVGGNYVGDPNIPAGNYDMQIDYFRAYSVAVPEPGSLCVLAGGGLLLLRRR